MTLWEEYKTYHPELVSRLDRVDKISKGRFVKRLKSEKDKDNFMSTITELDFYEFFQTRGFETQFEKGYSVKNSPAKVSPDLTITKHGQSIIVEVVRLNPTEKDSLRNDFENYLFNKLESIQLDYYLKFDIVEQYFDVDSYDREEIFK